jgi:hypothetical protein
MGAKISATIPVYGDASVFLGPENGNCFLCHPSGAQNFEVSPGYLENLCTPV